LPTFGTQTLRGGERIASKGTRKTRGGEYIAYSGHPEYPMLESPRLEKRFRRVL
jgi:hypothetical protein